MKRWLVGFVLVLLAGVPILSSRSRSASLLQDTDTAVLLQTIRETNAPLSWFAGDWPLKNHFYRPVSTLSFELDNRLYGDNAAGYGLTNALLVVACVLLLFWFLREITDRVVPAVSSTILFASWLWPWSPPFELLCSFLALAAVAVGIFRHGLNLRLWVLAPLCWMFVGSEIAGKAQLRTGVIDWLPGRTATVMSVFALIALAAYARYERLSAPRVQADAGPLDPPATKGTTLQVQRPKGAWAWALLSLAAGALALGAYEQAVMLPALMLSMASALRLQGYRPRWAWQAPIWGLLAVYLVLRQMLLPHESSGYQLQALRTGAGVWLDLSSYIFPVVQSARALWVYIESGLASLVLEDPWLNLVAVLSCFAVLIAARTRWKMVLTAYAMSVLAFLPMAWLNRFEHYHFFPSLFRAWFLVAVLWVALDWTVIAVSPPTRQAPPRPDPAPGSLPRP